MLRILAGRQTLSNDTNHSQGGAACSEFEAAAALNNQKPEQNPINLLEGVNICRNGSRKLSNK